MKVFAVLCMVVAAAAVASAGLGDLLDDTDFEALLNDEKQYKIAYNCIVGLSPCEGDQQKKMKEVMPILIGLKCIVVCTPEQKEKYDKLDKIHAEKYPEDHGELLLRFLPKNKETKE